ncbi:hypothetical protein GDO81_004572 [Engystomops pustulosus]|uniref:L-fucose mutarotase n=1 Tax=Engystomops pustulosus TaxID=76066 RepID=A0AAV7A0U6_ENGPU|nr:hypothetical protein GDO81_004572 [Engystomops pustulosus]
MVVLKGVPSVLSPELLYVLARMGHGDEIVLADANFPVSSISRSGPELVRADGLGIPRLLEAILQLLPLDTYVPSPAAVMDLVDNDKVKGLKTPVWDEYQSLLLKAGCERERAVWKPYPKERCDGSQSPGVNHENSLQSGYPGDV